jgi:hypothetical protein
LRSVQSIFQNIAGRRNAILALFTPGAASRLRRVCLPGVILIRPLRGLVVSLFINIQKTIEIESEADIPFNCVRWLSTNSVKYGLTSHSSRWISATRAVRIFTRCYITVYRNTFFVYTIKYFNNNNILKTLVTDQCSGHERG